MPQSTKAELPDIYRVAIGGALTALRNRANLTYAELAQRAGVSESIVRLIERNGERVPSMAVLYALAVALGQTPAGLLRGAEKILQKVAHDVLTPGRT